MGFPGSRPRFSNDKSDKQGDQRIKQLEKENKLLRTAMEILTAEVGEMMTSPNRVARIRKREDLYAYFNSLGFKVGCEVGVAEGINAENICKAIPGVTLYLVDHKSGWHVKDTWRGARLIDLRTRKSHEAALLVPDEALDFVYIDADHTYEYVMLDIILWSWKVRPGGIVSGHDYKMKEHPDSRKNFGVIEAVNDYARQHKLKVQLTGNGNNWFWVKPKERKK